MPAKSAKQERFMQAVANNPKFAKKVGVPQSVGREFTKAEGGEMKESKKMVKKEVAFMKAKGAPKSMVKHEEAEMKTKKMRFGGASRSRNALSPLTPAQRLAKAQGQEGYRMIGTKMRGGMGMKAGGTAEEKKMGIGGPTYGQRMRANEAARASDPAIKGRLFGRSIGNRIGTTTASDPSIKGRLFGNSVGKKIGTTMAKGGLTAGHKSADGIASKGKTKGTQVAMKRGGKCK